MRPNYRILAAIVVAMALPLAAAAQDDDVDEEIVVVGDKSISTLRREVYQAEEDFYELYNTLNDDPSYDVKCNFETATGTHVKNQVCRANFVAEAYARQAGRNRNDMRRMANQGADPALAEKTAIFEEKLSSLVNSNAELQTAFLNYNNARAAFFAAREAR
jgi:hypothetical protein